MGKVVMYSSVSVDGFVADENDQPGPLFDWLSSGDIPLDESGELKVSQTSYDYTRPYWDQIGVTIVGRHVFDMTDGWDGKPPGGIDHVVVVSHRPMPEGWDPEAPFHFVDGVEAAMAKAQELAGDRMVEVAAGDVGGQVLAAGLIDEVRMDVVPVVFGSGKRYSACTRSLGPCSGHSAWDSDSTATKCPASSDSRISGARNRAPPISTDSSPVRTSSGPRTPTRTDTTRSRSFTWAQLHPGPQRRPCGFPAAFPRHKRATSRRTGRFASRRRGSWRPGATKRGNTGFKGRIRTVNRP
ncbi:hypothetical protein AB0L53_56380 [Nonomuraea sp. NPDC052129]|uniref:dihydrofolate reductase family protein n=1 Tax=Nonomuraea sp. NPDC052129 TaxID=3154651 RepID=UPI003425B086